MIFMEDFLLTALVKHVSPNRIKMHKTEYSWHWHFEVAYFFVFAYGSKQNKTQTIFPNWFRCFKGNCFILQYSGEDEIKINFTP